MVRHPTNFSSAFLLVLHLTVKILPPTSSSSLSQSCPLVRLSLLRAAIIAVRISWVHAWTVNDGVITQVREYFNTSVTVTRLQSQPSDQSNQISSSRQQHHHCQPLWESSLANRAGKSVPGLVLAL
ncbi:Wound-induced protein 1 [Bienertia sinuspersici]